MGEAQNRPFRAPGGQVERSSHGGPVTRLHPGVSAAPPRPSSAGIRWRSPPPSSAWNSCRNNAGRRTTSSPRITVWTCPRRRCGSRRAPGCAISPCGGLRRPVHACAARTPPTTAASPTPRMMIHSMSTPDSPGAPAASRPVGALFRCVPTSSEAYPNCQRPTRVRMGANRERDLSRKGGRRLRMPRRTGLFG
jgi:hypothetical protein